MQDKPIPYNRNQKKDVARRYQASYSFDMRNFDITPHTRVG